MSDSMYWDANRILSYDMLFNYVIGERGNGKSYGAKKIGIKRFLKSGKQFIYLRRYESEIKKAKKNFFKDMDKYFPDNKFEVKGDELTIDENTCGYLCTLSVSDNYKSVPYPDVDLIIFDEFIIENIMVHHYLNDEVNKFLSFYDSIGRTRDIKVLFLANAVTCSNPHFLYWDIEPSSSEFTRFKNIDSIIQVTDCKEYKEFRKSTRFGKMIKNTSYGKYALDNKFLLDTPTFISKKTGQCIYVCTLYISNYKIGVWQERGNINKLFCSFDTQNNNINISLNMESHTENTILSKSNPILNHIKRTYLNGGLFFESQKIKGIMNKTLKTFM